MNNNSKRVLIAFAVSVIVLLSIFLLLNRTPIAIAGFIFSLLAPGIYFGMMYMTAAGTRGKYITNTAFILQARSYAFWNLAVCVVFVLMDQCGIWHAPAAVFCVIQLILLALFVWRYLAMDAGQEEIHNVEKKVKVNVVNWKMIEADVRNIKESASAKYHKDIDSVIDAIRYADPMSCPELVNIDDSIKDNVLALELAVQKNDDDNVSMTVMKILRLIKERNMKTKILK